MSMKLYLPVGSGYPRANERGEVGTESGRHRSATAVCGGW